MKLDKLLQSVQKTEEWQHFSDQTKRQYSTMVANSLDLVYEGVIVGDMKLSKLTKEWAEWMYQEISKRGATTAKQTRAAYNAMFKIVGMESPFITAELVTLGKEVCQVEDIVKLLDTAYSTFKYRNIGLIIQLVYITGQPVSKVAQLTWEDVNLLEMEVNVDGIRVAIDADTVQMLRSQENDFGFQRFVAPSPFPTKAGYVAYGDTQFSRTLNKLKKDAGFGIMERITIAEIRRAGLIARIERGASSNELTEVAPDLGREQIRKVIEDAGIDSGVYTQ